MHLKREVKQAFGETMPKLYLKTVLELAQKGMRRKSGKKSLICCQLFSSFHLKVLRVVVTHKGKNEK